jgi:hypothetical protein
MILENVAVALVSCMGWCFHNTVLSLLKYYAWQVGDSLLYEKDARKDSNHVAVVSCIACLI